jgi:tyrosyl-tRNA synthetase
MTTPNISPLVEHLATGVDIFCPVGEKVWIVDLVRLAGLATAIHAARHLIEGGMVAINGKTVTSVDLMIPIEEINGAKLKVGQNALRQITWRVSE